MKRLAVAMLMLSLVFVAAPVAARARLDIAHVRYGEVASLDDVSLEVGADQSLEIRIAVANLDSLPIEKLRFNCALVIDAISRRCAGTVRARVDGKARRGTLALALDDQATSAELSRDKAKLTWLGHDDGSAEASAKNVPVEWLLPLVRRVLDGAKLNAGTFSGDARIGASETADVTADWQLDDFGFDNADGSVAAASLDARGKIAVSGAAATRAIAFDATLESGEVLVSPLYLKLPETPVVVTASLRQQGGDWNVEAWHWLDTGTLDAKGSAVLANASLRELNADVAMKLPAAYDRYLQSVLAPKGFGEVITAGSIAATVSMALDRTTAVEAKVEQLDLADAGGRFAVKALDGEFAMHRDARARSVRWQSAALFGLPIEAGELTATSDAERWQLTKPVALKMLGGQLRIDRLSYATGAKNASAESDATSAPTSSRIDAALTLDRLSVAALAARFGWPEFGGRLSGRIPAIHSENERIVFEGGLDLELFDGKVRLDELAMERPFGVAPSLAADVALDNLDLALVTNTFSFGSIEGRLDGRIDDLRLVDWKPVAFDLALLTDAKQKGKRRISQKAVNSLSSVGGGGAAAGLQTAVMRVFDSFPYARIGLRCRLANNICRMGGIEPIGNADGSSTANATYTIVRGSGLPHLTVQGFQRNVDWPVLVDRLKAATSGTAPIVQ